MNTHRRPPTPKRRPLTALTTPTRRMLDLVEPDRPPVYPAPFVNLTNNRRASATQWADSHMSYCHEHFRYWTGNSNGQSFSHSDRGVNY